MGQPYLTKRIDDKLEDLCKRENVHKEGLGNTLLILSMCDEEHVKRCVNLIKAWNIKGGVEMENRDL